MNYLSYFASVAFNVLRLPKADVVISTSPQFFAGLAGAMVAAVHRRPWILEVRDIWPESISAVGAIKKGWGLKAVEAVEAWAYRHADQVVVVSPAFVAHVNDRGPLKNPVAVVENGVDLELFSAPKGSSGGIPAVLQRRIIFGYIGTHGMAHALETILHAASLTIADERVGWLLVGTGAERERLVKMKDDLGLSNVVMLDHLPRRAMPDLWRSIDVSLVVLRKSSLFMRVIPSKMFEAMAMARPIILAVDGEARRIVEQGQCGVFVEPENSHALAAAVQRLADDPHLRARLGAAGAAFVRDRYDRRHLAVRYAAIIENTISAAVRPNANG